MPPFFRESLEKARKFTLASNVVQLAAAAKVRETLEEAGASAFALKGTALLESGFYRPGERAMSDVDLLVQRENLGRAMGALLAGGWQEESPRDRDYFFRHHHNVRLIREDSAPVILELHWTCARGERRMPEWGDLASPVWEKTSPPRLSPSSHLHFLSVNAALHGYTGRLLFLYDLRRVIERSGEAIDWTHFLALGKQTKTLQASLLALACAGKIFGVSVPEKILEELGFPGRNFLRSLIPFSKWSGVWRSRALRFLMADSLAERARMIWAGGGRWLAKRA